MKRRSVLMGTSLLTSTAALLGLLNILNAHGPGIETAQAVPPDATFSSESTGSLPRVVDTSSVLGRGPNALASPAGRVTWAYWNVNHYFWLIYNDCGHPISLVSVQAVVGRIFYFHYPHMDKLSQGHARPHSPWAKKCPTLLGHHMHILLRPKIYGGIWF
jgi:hypothetical protein